MIASTHLAVGAAVGLTVQKCLSESSSPEKLFWAFVVGVASHVVLDALPHKEYTVDGLRLWLVLLVETGVVFALVLSLQNSLLLNLLIFFGMAGGAIPDLIELSYRYFVKWPLLVNLGSKIHIFHGTIPTGLEVNFYFQLLIAFAAIILVKFKPAF